MINNHLTIYADLNCPFCYALHERLMASGEVHRVNWRSIEHAPQISFDTKDIPTQSDLAVEVNKVKSLAPDVKINIPKGRPNTRIANELLTQCSQSAPQQVDFFRARLFRALWINGDDISDALVLEKILNQSSIDSITIDDATLTQLELWQTEWEQGDFSRNIPALSAAAGNTLLGLPSAKLLTLFIYGDRSKNDIDSDSICELKPRETILIVTEDTALNKKLSAIFEEYEIKTCSKNNDAIELALSNMPPDLIVLNAQENGFLTCQVISEKTQSHIIPVIILSDKNDEETELNAFEVGAAEFMHKDTSPAILRARTRMLLRLKRANSSLDEAAHMDTLTEIPNRREYDRVIDLEWRQSIRANTPLSIILLDIDNFKKYNDTYGHIEGDNCLRKFAQFLQRNIRRPTDLVARYGGEEFVIILPDTDENGALNVAHLIMKQLFELRIPHEHSPSGNLLTVSQGVASCFPKTSGPIKLLVNSADKALYKAKDGGRNRIVSAEHNH
ncbi:MAG: diguanylate cyclase [Ectothiorhodospiraceae bacterium]|nr:diguanylate cyclase [Ectothiorhodospiraceae bacterium]